jgi:putative cardiolipin synthase
VRKLLGAVMLALLTGCNAMEEPRWQRTPEHAKIAPESAPLRQLLQKATPNTTTDNTAHTMSKKNTALAATMQKASQAHAPEDSGIYPLTDGIEAFAVRNALIKNAKTSIDLQYYTLHHDLSSRLLVREMVHAADRGVRIRILIDDMDVLGRDREMTILSAHKNIDVRIYNPIRRMRGTFLTRSIMFLANLNTQHRRMHNKTWIADGVLAITGGRNIGDKYFNAGDTDNFSDLDVLLGGPIVGKLSDSFDAYWNAPQVFPVELFSKHPEGDDSQIQKIIFKTNAFTSKERVARHPYLKALDTAEQKVLPTTLKQMLWGQVNFYADEPSKIEHAPKFNHLHVEAGKPANSDSVPFNALLPLIENAKKEVLIINPYFIPGDQFTALLAQLVQNNVRVVVLTNSLESNDVPMINGPYGRYRQQLLQAGVELYELRANPDVEAAPQWRLPIFTWRGSRAALHTKAVLIDEQISFVGSMNLDPRSVVWNTEVGVIAHQTELTNKIKQVFNSAISPKYSYHLTLNAHNQITWSSHLPNTAATTKEPTPFWRRVSRRIGTWLPERYL